MNDSFCVIVSLSCSLIPTESTELLLPNLRLQRNATRSTIPLQIQLLHLLPPPLAPFPTHHFPPDASDAARLASPHHHLEHYLTRPFPVPISVHSAAIAQGEGTAYPESTQATTAGPEQDESALPQCAS